MDPINKAYQKTIYENRGPSYEPWMNKQTKAVIDLIDDMYTNPTQEKVMSAWRKIKNMFNLGRIYFVDSMDMKDFLKDFEEVGMDMSDNEKNIDAAMIKKHMKKWIV